MNKRIVTEIKQCIASILAVICIGTIGFWLGRYYQYKHPAIEPGCIAPPHSAAALKAMCPGAYVIDDDRIMAIFKDGSITTVYSSNESERRAAIQKDALSINHNK